MEKVLITGFTPFDDRPVNASWVAASAIDGARQLEIPVIWGAPEKLLTAACQLDCPEIIISLGEGRTGWFDIETVALNTRQERADNNNQLPEGNPIDPGGPSVQRASINADKLQRQLFGSGFPIRVSSNAGQFLCEETLYLLESLKNSNNKLRKVVFCHVPPFDSELFYQSKPVKCDQALLKHFAQQLLAAVH